MTLMGLFNIFRSRPPIRDRHELAQFIDENAAFLVQKGIYEYARARAGHYAKVLFKESLFAEAVERSRWTAYPLGLAMIGELVEGVLRPLAAEADRGQQLKTLRALVLSVFDRYPTPAALGEASWRQERVELARRLQLIGLHPPKRSFEIPEPFAKAYFDLMPIHRKLRASEFPTLHGYLKVTLCNIHDELTKRLDAEAIASSLQAPGAAPLR
jgi:hypothetical protein